jgi:hypothetical protein
MRLEVIEDADAVAQAIAATTAEAKRLLGG